MDVKRGRQFRFLGWTIYFALVVSTVVGALGHPAYNWDVVAYTVCVNSLHTDDALQAHRDSFEELRSALPPSDFASLTVESPADTFKAAVFENPSAMRQQLAFYRIKPLYITALDVLHAAGLSVLRSSLVLNCFSILLIAIVLALWIKQITSPLLAPFLCVLGLLGVGAVELARISTPDAFATLFELIALYLIVHRGKLLLGLMLAALALFTRSDVFAFILPCVLVLRSTYLQKRVSTLVAAIVLLSCIAYIFAVQTLAHYPGWQVHYYNSFIAPLVTYEGQSITVSPVQYITHAIHGLALLPPDNILVPFLLLAVVGAFLLSRSPQRSHQDKKYLAFAAALMVGIGIHFVTYTAFIMRFFAAQYLFFLILLVYAHGRAGQLLSSKTSLDIGEKEGVASQALI